MIHRNARSHATHLLRNRNNRVTSYRNVKSPGHHLRQDRNSRKVIRLNAILRRPSRSQAGAAVMPNASTPDPGGWSSPRAMSEWSSAPLEASFTRDLPLSLTRLARSS